MSSGFGFDPAPGSGPTPADRQAAIARLRRHAVSGGAVSAADLADRIRRIEQALTRAGIDQVLADLPREPPAPPWAIPGAPPPDVPEVPHVPEVPDVPEVPPASVDPVPSAGPVLPPPQAPRRWAPAAPPAPVPRGPTTPVAVAAVGVGVVLLVVMGSFVSLLLAGSESSDGSDDGVGEPSELPASTAAPASTVAPATTAALVTSTTTTTVPTTTTTALVFPEAPPDGDILFGQAELRRVGQDIQPGRYLATPESGACYWERVSGFGGGFDDILANGATSGRHVIVEVLASDAGLRSTGCGDWRPYAPATTLATRVGDGDWLVGADVVAGTYRRDGTSGLCYWARSRGFTHELTEVIEDTVARGNDVTIELVDGESFSSELCGTWTRV